MVIKMNVPKLRFKEFNDKWNEIILDELIEEKNLKTGNISKYPLWSLTLEDGVTPKTDRYERKFLVKKDNNYKIVEPQDYVYNPMNAHLGAIARNKSNNYISVSGYYNVFKINSNNYGFFDNYFISPCMFKKYKLISTGSLLEKQRVHYSQFRELKIKIPSNHEMEKISCIFELLNKRIELQSKKIEDLKLYKKGLILREFSSSNLREISIKELGRVITGTTPSKDNNIYWENGNIAWITPTDITYYKDINSSSTLLTSEGLKKGRFIPKNSILITCISSIGKNAKLLVDGSCNQQINAIIPDKQYNSDYIYYLMEYMETYFKSIAGTTATSIINKETFENIKVKIHSFEKREFIGNFLNYFENKILLEDLKLENLRKIKKGFMQNMFV